MHAAQDDAKPASLYEDIRQGTARIQKMKADHKNQGNFVGKNKYSLEKVPQIFIRKAVDSDEEEGKGQQGQKGKKKYREAGKEREGREGREGRKEREEEVKVKFSS
jgi:hypothetical protein